MENLLFNSRFVKFVIDKGNKINKKINDKINNSNAYKAYNKIFPYAFLCSSILVVPSMYLLNGK